MDAGAVTGKRKAILGDEAVCEGREDGGKAEKVLEPFPHNGKRNPHVPGRKQPACP